MLALSAGVTFETKAVGVPDLLARLSPVVGRKLECDGAFASEVMVVAVTDVTADDLLAKIARAGTGVWEKEGDRLILKPDAKRRAEQERERVDTREKRVQVILDRCARELAVDYKGETQKERKDGVTSQSALLENKRRTPMSRLAMRLLVGIGAKELAEVQGMDRRVYAVSPNALQRAWPKGGEAALAEFRKEWKTRQDFPHEINGILDIGGNWSSISGMGVSPDMTFNRIWISIGDVFNTSGSEKPAVLGLFASTFTGITGTVDLYEPPAGPIQPEVSPDDTALTFEPETVEFAKVFSPVANVDHLVLEPGSALGSMILKEGFEPLAMGSELYLQFAKTKGLDMVSLVSDGSLTTLFSLGQKEVKASALEQVLRRSSTYEEEEGWLVTAPSQHAESRRSRDDRKMMRQVILDSADGKLTLDTECAYVVTKPYSFTANLSMKMAAMFDSSLSALRGVSDELQKRAYGLLPKDLKKGGRITYAQASKDLQKALWTAVYCRQMLVPADYPSEMAERTRPNPMGPEMTFLFPQGIAGDRVFDVEVKPFMEIRQSISQAKSLVYGDESVASTAWELFFEKNPELIVGTRTWPMPDRYQALRSEKILLKLSMPEYYAMLRLKDQMPEGPGGPLDKLPAQFRKAVEDELAKLNQLKAAGNAPVYYINSDPRRKAPPP